MNAALLWDRRAWLTLTLAATVSGCSRTPIRFQGTFFQPWQDFEAVSPEDWRKRMRAVRALGCSQIVLQWSAHYGNDHPWTMSDRLLALLFDTAGNEGIGVRLGLPYDEGWWKALADDDKTTLPTFLKSTQKRCIDTLQHSRWPDQAGFRGWYLPYELDQYNWADRARRDLLLDWLTNITEVASQRVAAPLAASTFFSQLPTPGTLVGLWTDILDRMRLRPMLQDGVGVGGMRNYAGLEPLRQLLLQRAISFDLIVELFEQLPSLANTNGAFHARSASQARLRAQLQIAENYGADQIIAFAIDPWILGSSPEALQLRKDVGLES